MLETRPVPTCFGIIDNVFPLGEEELRSIRPACFQCEHLTRCLKTAADSPDGRAMRADRMEAMRDAAGGGLRGFFHRWAELKQLRQGSRKK